MGLRRLLASRLLPSSFCFQESRPALRSQLQFIDRVAINEERLPDMSYSPFGASGACSFRFLPFYGQECCYGQRASHRHFSNGL